MKYVFFVLGFIPVAFDLLGQTTPLIPYDVPTTFSGVHSITAPYEIYAPYQGVGPVVIYNTAQVDFTASERIHLQPGFQAVNFTGNGYFHAQIGHEPLFDVPDFDVVFIEPNSGYPQVGLNNKLELGLRLPATLETQVQNFINGTAGGINPFDEGQIKVKATFTNSLSTVTIDAFYFEDFERDPTTLAPMDLYNWIPQPTIYNWRIRFAPPFLGTWRAKIEIFIGNSSSSLYSVDGIEFGCIPSSNPGYLRVGTDDRHLKFSSTGGSFFAIGQNIAWCGPRFNGQVVFTQPYLYDDGILDLHNWISSLAENGGNFVRFIVTPQFGEIEWGALGNYASPNAAQSPVASNTGLAQAWELDQMFSLCESKNVYLMFNVAFQGEHISGSSDPWYGWENNPYNLEIAGVNQPTDIFRNPTAHDEVMRNLKNKYRYYLSRWGYSTSLGVFELCSEFENWTGNIGITSSDAVNDGLRSDAYTFLEELATDIKSSDLGYNHLLGISISNRPWDDVQDPEDHVFDSHLVDVTSWHGYHNERTAARTFFNETNGVIGQGMYSDWNKPTIASEMGLIQTDVINQQPIADPNDIASCSDITFHNYMWSTAFSGGYGTGLNWWQWFNDSYREQNFPAISTFFSTVDFEANSFSNPGRWDDGLLPTSDNSILETVYLKSSNNEHAIGWVHNMSYWWGNMDQNCEDRYNRPMPIRPFEYDPVFQSVIIDPGDYDDIWTSPQSTLDLPLIEGLTVGRYSVSQYSTRNNGGLIGNPITIWTDIFGRLMLPPLYNLSGNIPDYAVKVDSDPLFNFRQSGELVLDTAYVCLSDSVVVSEVNNLESLAFSWYVNGILYSSIRNTTFYFDSIGSCELQLHWIDTNGRTGITTQIITVLDCDSIFERKSTITTGEGQFEPIIYPNPLIDQFTIELGDESDFMSTIMIYSADGSLVGEYHDLTTTNITLPFNYNPGIYLIAITTSSKIYFKKITKLD